MPKRMSAAEWGLLLGLAAAWGGIFLFTRVALEGLPPVTLVAMRVGMAAPLLVALVYLQGHRLPREPSLWAAFALMGLLNNVVPFSLITWGQQTVTSGLAAILNAMTPFAAVLVCHFFTKDERATAAKLAGVTLGVAGVALLIGPGALTGLGRDVAAQGACLAATVSYAFAGLWGRRFRGLPPAVAAAGMVTCSALIMAPLALWHDRPWTLRPSWAALEASAAAAAIGTALAYWLYFRILAAAGATNLLLVTVLMPPAAVTLGAVFLGERFPLTALAGMGVIFVGLAVIDGRLPALWRRSTPARQPGD